MLDELPLELLLQILSSLHVSDRIKFREVNKKWRLVIDQYLLLELNLFDYDHNIQEEFQSYNLTHTDRKNSIRYRRTQRKSDPIWNSIVNLEKVKFLFRNARKLCISYCPITGDPLDEFISE